MVRIYTLHELSTIPVVHQLSYNCRIFPVSSSFLDSKKQFEAAIRNNLPFITMTGRARSEDLSDFMLHLTQDYESSGVQRRFYSAQYIGFHDPDTWVLSKKVENVFIFLFLKSQNIKLSVSSQK